jgi:hypothetical protein
MLVQFARLGKGVNESVYSCSFVYLCVNRGLT